MSTTTSTEGDDVTECNTAVILRRAQQYVNSSTVNCQLRDYRTHLYIIDTASLSSLLRLCI